MSKSCRVLTQLTVVLTLSGSLASVAPAQNSDAGIQSLDAVRTAAEAHVRSRIPQGRGKAIVTAGSLDPRLRFAPCGGPLQASSPTGSQSGLGRITVGVRCSEGATWTVYVPVTVESEISVLVLNRALARGARVTADDVSTQTRTVNGLSSAWLSSAQELKGHTLKRPLPAGTVLAADVLVPDYVVRRGEQVTLLAQAGGIQVRMAGRALADGHAGARLKVQNLSSLAVVEGVVDSEGVIRVSP